MPHATSSPKPKRRLWRYSLASLLLVITAIGAWLAPIVNRAHRQQRVVAAVEQLGGQVIFYEDMPHPLAGLPWLRRWLGVEYFRTVRMIQLQGTAADDQLVDERSHLSQIESLMLTKTRITDESLRHVARLKQLKALDVGFNPITNDGLRHLAPLDELLFLGLDVTKVSDEGLPVLKELPRLYRVQLYADAITDAGAAALAETSQLSELDVANTKISNAGLAHLARMPQLRWLRLDQMITGQGEELRINDEGLQHVASMTKLNHVGLTGLAVTDRGLATLRQSRPGLAIQR